MGPESWWAKSTSGLGIVVGEQLAVPDAGDVLEPDDVFAGDALVCLLPQDNVPRRPRVDGHEPPQCRFEGV